MLFCNDGSCYVLQTFLRSFKIFKTLSVQPSKIWNNMKIIQLVNNSMIWRMDEQRKSEILAFSLVRWVGAGLGVGELESWRVSGLNPTRWSNNENASGGGLRTFLKHCQGALVQVNIPRMFRMPVQSKLFILPPPIQTACFVLGFFFFRFPFLGMIKDSSHSPLSMGLCINKL